MNASGRNLAKVMHIRLLPSAAEVLAQPSILVQVHGGNGQCLQATVSDFRFKYRSVGPNSFRAARLTAVGQ